ncbi:hypothetical protein B0H16DRAFT_54608 [Mycena metata]|uniref:Uncharacterized protein n=1 Tax=Mycena metata TaxID=1033252 RepID=A0AAD7IDD7_9AGAR|nr:hypothetical protein B0H16DRAFT_54608 [Mycena metata]
MMNFGLLLLSIAAAVSAAELSTVTLDCACSRPLTFKLMMPPSHRRHLHGPYGHQQRYHIFSRRSLYRPARRRAPLARPRLSAIDTPRECQRNSIWIRMYRRHGNRSDRYGERGLSLWQCVHPDRHHSNEQTPGPGVLPRGWIRVWLKRVRAAGEYPAGVCGAAHLCHVQLSAGTVRIPRWNAGPPERTIKRGPPGPGK